MVHQTNAVTFLQNLGEMLNVVQYRHDSVVINKDGKPVAALIDARLFDRIRRMQSRFDALCQRIEGVTLVLPRLREWMKFRLQWGRIVWSNDSGAMVNA